MTEDGGKTRESLLGRLADALRPLRSASEIQSAVARVVGEHLGANRVNYAEIDGDHAVIRGRWVEGVALLPERFPVSAFGEEILAACRRGEDVVAHDVAIDPRFSEAARARLRAIETCAFLGVTLVKDGEWVAVLGVQSKAPRRWTDAELALVREVAERTWDAAERARAEAALSESEEKYRSLFETMDEGFSICELVRDADGTPVDVRYLELNRAFEDLTGFCRADAIGRLRSEIVNRPAPEALAKCAEAVATGEPARFEHLDPALRRWYEVRVIPRGGDRFAVLYDDISERKQTELALQQALEQAEAANKAKDDFLATLSHELRTPLAAILLWGGALRSGAVPMADLARAIEAIVQSARTQSRLVDDLLDLSRLAAGKLSLARVPVDVARVARGALDVVKPVAAEKRVAIVEEIEDGLGEAVLDPARLQQILWNLLSNGTKFTPAGGTVSLRVRKADGELTIEVADTGEGIAPDFMPHVFERFRQADMAATRPHMGLGVGLALTKELAELHGGTIEAHSDGRGHGALFRVRIPWRVAHPRAAIGRTSTEPDAELPLDGVRVLVVEDDQSTREAMEWTLDHAGARVTAVASALGALEAMDREPPPDVIVSDLGLPGMTGYELITRVVEVCRTKGRRSPPACALSAHARDVDRQQAIDAGFDIYVPKPVTPARLVEAVVDLRDVARSSG